MASDNSGAQIASYACRCLNVRIISSTPTSSPPDYPRDQAYMPVFVKEDGISVAHPQVTVRLTSKPEHIHGSSKYSRFTSVTCLFCNLAIYRVHRTISLDVEGNETVLLPTEEWVEQEILKSATGWIDVHTDSIIGNDISTAESSSSFTTPFSLLLPSSPSPPPSTEVENASSSNSSSPEAPPEYMTTLKPLFLPPPFTSSHPIFIHLVSIANETSKQIRAAAEQRITDFVKAETVGVENEENVLKGQVEVLWTSYREHLQTVQKEGDRRRNSTRSTIRSKDSGVASPAMMSSSVTIKSFVPQTVSPSPLATSTSLPRVSALSASLATSHFHHPRANDSRQAASPGENSSSRSRSTSQTGSSTLVHSVQPTEGINILEFKRNLDEGVNTQATYRFFVIEKEMQALKKRREEASRLNNKDAGPSQISSNPISTEIPKPDPQTTDLQPAAIEAPADSNDHGVKDSTPTRGRDKGKRKVTFDVKPAVVTFKNGSEAQEEEANKAKEDSRDMIFSLEDMEGMGIPDIAGDPKQTTLPLLEQPTSRPIRGRTSRPQNKAALEAFASLRPASLPNPSHIRPMRSQPGVDSSSQSMLPSRVYSNTNTEVLRKPASPQDIIPLNEHDAEILKLVAADTPSHRGAWTPGSKAWRSFTRRQDSKEDVTLDNIDEENSHADEARPKPINMKKPAEIDSSPEDSDDDEDELPPYRFIPGSLPININRPKPKEPLSLASFLPPSALPSDPTRDAGQSSGSVGRINSVAIHNATYAERDRNRAMDPGALDFAIAEEDEEEEEEDRESSDKVNNESTSPGEKARKRALKILQARSELPEEGMWRSLA